MCENDDYIVETPSSGPCSSQQHHQQVSNCNEKQHTHTMQYTKMNGFQHNINVTKINVTSIYYFSQFTYIKEFYMFCLFLFCYYLSLSLYLYNDVNSLFLSLLLLLYLSLLFPVNFNVFDHT